LWARVQRDVGFKLNKKEREGGTTGGLRVIRYILAGKIALLSQKKGGGRKNRPEEVRERHPDKTLCIAGEKKNNRDFGHTSHPSGINVEGGEPLRNPPRSSSGVGSLSGDFLRRRGGKENRGVGRRGGGLSR